MNAAQLARVVSSMHGLMPEGSRAMLAGMLEQAILEQAPSDEWRQMWKEQMAVNFYNAARIMTPPAEQNVEVLIERWDKIDRYKDAEGWHDLNDQQIILMNTLISELREFWAGTPVKPLGKSEDS